MKVLLALAVLAAGCGDDDSMMMGGGDLTMQLPHDMAIFTTGDAAMSASVDINDNFYAPRNTTISNGGTVTWTWRGSNSHTVTADDGSFDSSPAKSTGTFTHTFTTVGSFPYHCMVHGSLMSGTITVQ
jgi:plastocyanin